MSMKPWTVAACLFLQASAHAAIEDADPRNLRYNVATAGGFAYFPGTTPGQGQELWRTDGTAAGTQLVYDIVAGATGSSPQKLVAAGSNIFFSANDSVAGRELWVSDGTSVGTHLVADISPGAGSSNPHHITVVGNAVFFAAFTTGIGWRLWRSDGTASGTVALADPLPSTTTDEFDYNWHHSFCGGTTLLFFNATDPVGNRLWVSDGTAVGTHAVLPTGGAGNQPIALGAIGDRCFYASVNSGSFLWSSDGTAAGTAAMPGGVTSADFNTGINGKIFTRGTTGAYTNGIYVSDASLAAPTLTSTAMSAPGFFSDVAGRAFTDVDVPGSSVRQIGVSDGTPAGTSIVPMQTGGLHMPVGNQLYFTTLVGGVSELWRTDGTTAGTVAVTTAVSDPVAVGAVNGKALATHYATWNTYDQLWASNGTPGGTIQIMPPAIGGTSTATSTTSGSGTPIGSSTASTTSSGTATGVPGSQDEKKNFFCGTSGQGAVLTMLMLLMLRARGRWK